MKVPVKILVDPENKEFEVTIGTPTTAALIVSALKIEKGSGKPNEEKVGDLTMQQVISIAKKKRSEMLAKSLELASKEVIGTCVSMGVTVEGKAPRDVQKEINEGKYSSIFEAEK
jgi:large subunit ribosomal protein L11